MPKIPTLIIICGPPCTGKTTLSKRLSHKYNLPVLSRDDLKEVLFNNLGWSDANWFQRVSQASLDIMFLVIELFLKSKQSLIIDSTLDPKKVTAKFLKAKKKYRFNILQINCRTHGERLYRRYLSRSSKQHPGYVNHLRINELKPKLLRGHISRLQLPGEYVEFETTDFKRLSYKLIDQKIRELLA